MMPIAHIPDWEKRIQRQDAFWDCEIIDRPVVCITVPRAELACPFPPPKEYATHKERWLDIDRIAESTRCGALNWECMGDALPTAFPNLGPDVTAAFLGVELEFGQSTSWAIHCVEDWSQIAPFAIQKDNFYWRKMEEMTDTLLEVGKNTYYTGITDLHPASSILCAFRDPMMLNMDLAMVPEQVKPLVAPLTQLGLEIYDYWCDKVSAAGQAITTWAGIVSSRRWYPLSNYFSCMISTEMFEEFFLDGLIEECRHIEASLYHLDGPGALRHLDALLDIKELNAIQWVYGAGRGRTTDWLDVYKKCQAAGKGIQLQGVGVDELDTIMENLRPEGVWMYVGGVNTREEADAVIKKVSTWR